MPTSLDLAFVVFFAVIMTVFETVVFFPRFKRAIAAGKPDARGRAYRRAILGQWLFAAAAVAIWVTHGRSWRALGLVPPTGMFRLAVSIAIIAFMTWFILRQARGVARLTPEKREKLRPRLAAYDYLLPHTHGEYRWFTALSFTAGFCEELLYRGYMLWVFQAYVGLVGAVAGSVLLFGIGHSYQGWRGVIKTGTVALVMNVIVIGTGWLIPAMVVHALVDASSGMLGYAVYGAYNVVPTPEGS